jgi:hypothetical protein
MSLVPLPICVHYNKNLLFFALWSNLLFSSLCMCIKFHTHTPISRSWKGSCKFVSLFDKECKIGWVILLFLNSAIPYFWNFRSRPFFFPLPLLLLQFFFNPKSNCHSIQYTTMRLPDLVLILLLGTLHCVIAVGKVSRSLFDCTLHAFITNQCPFSSP